MTERLYILDEETGEKFLLAKSYGGGWIVWNGPTFFLSFIRKLNIWLGLRDHPTGAESQLKLIVD